MSIGSTTFHPSAIEDEIYDILDSSPDFIVSSSDYTPEAIDKVIEFMAEKACKNGCIDGFKPLYKKDIEQIDNEIKNIESKWEEKQKKLAYYIEHDELEKVGNIISKLYSNVENRQKEIALENVKEIEFLLTHIQNKSILNLQNVF